MGLLSRLFGIEDKKKPDDKKRVAPERPKTDSTPPSQTAPSVEARHKRSEFSESSAPKPAADTAKSPAETPKASAEMPPKANALASSKTELIDSLELITDDAERIKIGRANMTNQAENKNAFASPDGVNEAKILEVLSEVYDPEIPIDIVNLGLIYGVEIQDGRVLVKMTMTAPGCPSSAQMAAEAKSLVEELPGVKEAAIEIVWEPAWDPSRMSEDAKQSLGYV